MQSGRNESLDCHYSQCVDLAKPGKMDRRRNLKRKLRHRPRDEQYDFGTADRSLYPGAHTFSAVVVSSRKPC